MSTRQKSSWVLVAAAVIALAACEGRQEAEHKGHSTAAMQEGMAVFQGEVLDMACYMAHEGKGKKHKKCAATCIAGGAPIGLLTKEGGVYLLVEDHENKLPYEGLKSLAAEKVRVTGEVHSRGGVQAVVIAKVERM